MSLALRPWVPLSLLVCGLSYGIWHYHSDAGRLRQELQANKLTHLEAMQAKEREMQSALAAQNQLHQKALATLQADHERRLAELRNQQNRQMNLAIKEFEGIFAGNKRSLEELDKLEDAVAKGKSLSNEEIQRLSAIASGIGFLKNQYRKPMQEFTALQSYFEEAAQKTAPTQKPSQQFGFFKRLFSREFREAEKEALREEGAKRAFDEASGKFEATYQSAQQSIKRIDLDVEALQTTLQVIMSDKEKASKSDLAEPLRKIREALSTHQKVLDFTPQTETPKVQP